MTGFRSSFMQALQIRTTLADGEKLKSNTVHPFGSRANGNCVIRGRLNYSGGSSHTLWIAQALKL